MPEVAASLPTACALPLGREYGVYVSIQTGGTEGLVMSDDEDGNGTAVSHLYRFRSIKNLLDRDELENQEIFLAHPDAMNDPTEGIKDVFWQGDKIVWENLFKHYLVCLNTAWALLSVCGENHSFDWKNIPINYLGGQSLTGASVFANTQVSDLAEELYAI
jgi:hypothetical protein